MSMRALPPGHVYSASSLAVTKGGQLSKRYGTPQLRSVEGMGSASGHALAKLVDFPLVSLAEEK